MDYIIFLALFFAIYGVVIYYDYILVALMHWLNYWPYPLATDIARLIYEHPDEWVADPHHMHHPAVGAIWTANKAYGLRVESPHGIWTPGKIERRIIREAVDWRIKQYVVANMGQPKPQGGSP